MTTVNDFVDILRIIREQPEWGEALRAALLSREVLELPQRLAEFSKATDRRLSSLEGDVVDLKAGQARLEGDVADLKAGQARLEGDVAELKIGQSRLEVGQSRLEAGHARLEGSLGNLQGGFYEQKVANNIATLLRHPLDIRRVRVLKGYGAANLMTFEEFMDAAEERGDISRQERTEASSADIVLQGQRASDGSIVYVAVEVSVTAANSDISRAANRSELLHRATGEVSLPAVVSAHIDGDRQRLARQRNVTLIGYGE